MERKDRYPSLSDIKRRAKRRIPYFAWEYLDSGTGSELQVKRNRADLDAVLFDTQILQGAPAPDFKTSFLGHDFDLPFGVAPIGMSGMIWPGAEYMLAQAAQDANIPFALSTVATKTPEMIAPYLGDQAWFQLYAPGDPEVRRDMLRRAKEAGFSKLVLTVDVPVPSSRERQRRSGLTMPPKKNLKMFASAAMCPEWALGTLRHGVPRLRLADDYTDPLAKASSVAHAGNTIRTDPDWEYFKALRDEWQGDLLVKGVMMADEAKALVAQGADAIWVSNHSGRQFDGGPSAVSILPDIREAVGPDFPLLFDSGIEGGLDILRAIALGANFVMLGRAWHYALAAFGADGPNHLIEMLRDDMVSNLGQLGVATPVETRGRLR